MIFLDNLDQIIFEIVQTLQQNARRKLFAPGLLIRGDLVQIRIYNQMIIVLEIDKHFLLLVRVRLWINRFDLRQMLGGERVLGYVLYAHFELEERADFVAIEQEFNDRIAALERLEQELERVGQS